jgi:hypothetical protein
MVMSLMSLMLSDSAPLRPMQLVQPLEVQESFSSCQLLLLPSSPSTSLTLRVHLARLHEGGVKSMHQVWPALQF